PFTQSLADHPLPRLAPVDNAAMAEGRESAARLQPAQTMSRDRALIEAMERLADHDQVERFRLRIERLGAADVPTDVRDASAFGLASSGSNHLRFEVDGVHFGERSREWNRKTPRPAHKIEQPL